MEGLKFEQWTRRSMMSLEHMNHQKVDAFETKKTRSSESRDVHGFHELIEETLPAAC